MFYFIHIPKTAGSTFSKIIRANYSPHERRLIYPAPDEMLIENLNRNRYGLSVLTGHFKYGFGRTLNDDNANYIAFIRKPIEQVLSHYFYLKKSNDGNHKEILKKYPDLDSFTEYPGCYNLQTQYLTGLTRHELKVNSEEEVLNDVINLNNLSIYITEYFSESVFLLAQRFNWKFKYYYTRNVNTTRKKIDQISPETLNRIKSITSLDQKIYDFFSKKFLENFNEVISGDSFREFRKKNNSIFGNPISKKIYETRIKLYHAKRSVLLKHFKSIII